MKSTTSSATAKSCAKILQLVPPWECDKAFEAIREGLSAKNADGSRELEDLLESPLRQLNDDKKGGRPFLLCEFNRYGDSYRSPWSNTLHPPGMADYVDDIGNDTLYTFESRVNEVWDAYRQQYYGTDAIGSVYLKDSSADDIAFLAVFLIQKETKNGGGRWTSSHFVTVGNVSTGTKSTKYQIRSTVHVTMEKLLSSNTDVGARLSKDTIETCKMTMTTKDNAMMTKNSYYPSHLENIGKLLESIEIDLRTSLEKVHFPKAQEALSQLYRRGQNKTTTGIPPMVMGGGIGMNPMMMGSLNKALSARGGLKKTTGKLP